MKSLSKPNLNPPPDDAVTTSKDSEGSKVKAQNSETDSKDTNSLGNDVIGTSERKKPKLKDSKPNSTENSSIKSQATSNPFDKIIAALSDKEIEEVIKLTLPEIENGLRLVIEHGVFTAN